MAAVVHPYIPKDLELPGFLPIALSQSDIVIPYIASSIAIVAIVWIVSGKEYSKGDSRYAGRDAEVVAVEGITAAIEGPVCLLAVYAIATRKPYDHTLQIANSLGQLYGCLVYFITAFLLGDNFSTDKYYYREYYIGANSSWVVVPTLVVIGSWRKISAAVQVEQKMKAR